MTRRAAAVVAGTLLALLGATLWVPERDAMLHKAGGRSWWTPYPRPETRIRPAWRAGFSPMDEEGTVSPGDAYQGYVTFYVVAWDLLLAEHSLILLVGGGLLTWTVRRERRRRAEAAA